LLHRTKAEIVRLGVELELDFSRTWSCYDPQPGPGSEPLPCGACDSCRLRRKGFAEAGVEDPQAPSGALGQGRGR
jgi:7-cyano-7-deazaguanine synthase